MPRWAAATEGGGCGGPDLLQDGPLPKAALVEAASAPMT